MRDLNLQHYSVHVGKEVFGVPNMTDPEERLLRFAEEAVELMRAAGLSYEKFCAIAAYEYHSRPKGEVSQEIAGTQITLYGLASALDVDVRTVVRAECDRVLANKEKIRQKHNAKPARFVAQRVA